MTIQGTIGSLYADYPIIRNPIREGMTLSRRVAAFGLSTFGMIQSLFLMGYGAHELFRNREGNDYPLIHGTLFITSGIYASLSALHELKLIDLKTQKVAINMWGDLFFVAANIAAIKHNVELFKKAFNTISSNHSQEAHRHFVMRSAAIGIVSNLCYITTALVPVIGLTSGYALVFGCTAVSTGGLKIVFDYVSYKNI